MVPDVDFGDPLRIYDVDPRDFVVDQALEEVLPNRFRVGPMSYKYEYTRVPGTCPILYQCEQSADAQGAAPTDRRFICFLENTWTAMHAPVGTQTVDAVQLVNKPIFGSTDNVLQEGQHRWKWWDPVQRHWDDEILTFDTTILDPLDGNA
jgi:hypothetical protein